MYHKRLLPNYAVFDEQRYFAPGTGDLAAVEVGGVRVGVSICEDAWSPTGPIAAQAAGGAELVVNLNASPYYAGRLAERERMLATRAADASVRARLRQPGRRPGRAGLRRRVAGVRRRRRAAGPGRPVHRGDRRSSTSRSSRCSASACSTRGVGPPRRRCRSSHVSSEPRVAEPATDAAPRIAEPLPPVREVYEALVLGTRDYVRKNGFTDVGHRPVGRHRLVAGGGHRRRRARRRARARRADAVALLVRPLAHRRRGAGRRPRHRPPDDRHRAGPRRVPRDAGPVLRRAASPTSPRRTCSPASGAWCSWRCRTSSAGWC